MPPGWLHDAFFYVLTGTQMGWDDKDLDLRWEELDDRRSYFS